MQTPTKERGHTTEAKEHIFDLIQYCCVRLRATSFLLTHLGFNCT